MNIPIREGVQFNVPEDPTALSWEDIQPALKQGKKCRRLQWSEDLYIKMNKNGTIYYHCHTPYGEKIKLAMGDLEGASVDTFLHDWVIIDKQKKK